MAAMRLFLALFAVLSFAATAVHAQVTWYVDDNACPGPGSGTPEDPFCRVQDAIDAAAIGDTVLVLPGRYVENIDLGFYITVRSLAGPEVTILDGGGLATVARVDTGSVIEGFTITNGFFDEVMGAGGVYVSFGTVRGNVIVGNTASRGGGVHINGFSVVEGNRIEQNEASVGGGIYVSGIGFLVRDNQIVGNHAFDGGGAWYRNYVEDTTKSTNNLYAGNHADRFGGGIDVGETYSFGVTFRYDSIVDNDCGDRGGGLYASNCEDFGLVDLVGCIVWGNQAAVGNDQIYLSTECTGTVAYNCVEGGGYGAIVTEDPLFVGATYYLTQDDSQTSPCVDVGPASGDIPPGSTAIDGRPDVYPIDLGYHNPYGLVTAADCQGIDGVDVLRVNGLSGAGNGFVVEVSSAEPLSATIELPAAGGEGRYFAQLHPGAPNASTLAVLPKELGPSCFDFQIAPYGVGEPLAVWNNLGRRTRVGSSRYFGTPIPDPAPAPTEFWSLPVGGDPPNLALGTSWTLQALIRNPDASSPKHASVTNSVVIVVIE